MEQQAYSCFGELTVKQNKIKFINDIAKNQDAALDVLFCNHLKKLEKLTVIQAEREAALNNLRMLTSQLQTKRLRNNVKSKNKYFTL